MTSITIPNNIIPPRSTPNKGSPQKGNAVDRDNIPPIRFRDIIPTLRYAMKNPKEAGLSIVSRLTLPIPILAGIPLMAGLIARWLSDESLKEGEIPNSAIRFIRDSYPLFYTAMLGCGLGNGASYASLCRMLSYGSLLYCVLSPGGLWQNENTRNKAMEQIALIQKPRKQNEGLFNLNFGLTALGQNNDFQISNPQDDNKLQKAEQDLADANAGISIFSRVWYCAGMFLTFLSNVTQQAPEEENLACKTPKSTKIKGFWNEFKEYFGFNSIQEWRAGKLYTGKLFHAESIKNFWQIMAGKNEAFEKSLTEKGIKENNFFKRIAMRMGHPVNNSMISMGMGLLRLGTVLTTLIMATAYLGGKAIFNEGTSSETKETKSAIKEHPIAKKIFDTAMFLNNIGMLLMGICSFATSFNLNYREKSGPIAALFQFLTGAFYSAAAACDQANLFVFSILFKITGNICALLANINGTAFSAYPKWLASIKK